MQSLLISLFRSPLFSEIPFSPSRQERFSSTFRFILTELRPYLTRSCSFSIGIEVCTILSALLAMSIIGEGMTVGTVLILSALYLINSVCIAVLAAFNYSVFDSIEGKVRERIAMVVSRKLYRLEDEQLKEYGRGKLKNLLDGDALAVGQLFWSFFFGIIPTSTGVLILAPTALLVGGIAILPALLLSPLAVLVTLWSTGLVRPVEEKLKQSEDSLLESVERWVQNMRLIRGMCWSSPLKATIAESAKKLLHLELIKEIIQGVVRTLSFSTWIIGTSIYLATAYLIGAKIELTGAFGAMWLLTNFTTRLQLLPNVVTNYSAAAVGMRRIDEFMRLPEEGESTTKAEGKLVSIELRDVEVVTGERTILAINHLILPTDRRILITGPVGAGKSTLLKLLVGEIVPTKGEVVGILECGSSLCLHTPEGRSLLRSSVAYQPQEPFTAQARLSFNVSLEDESGLSSIDEALRKSELLPDLALFNNEDILLGEHGVNLSGGQKQRVTLARAFHSARTLLVLDDPFSALDARTQELIANEILTYDGVIVSTHHPHLIMHPDKTVVLEEGSILSLIEGGK